MCDAGVRWSQAGELDAIEIMVPDQFQYSMSFFTGLLWHLSALSFATGPQVSHG
jgi:hypothetical protein